MTGFIRITVLNEGLGDGSAVLILLGLLLHLLFGPHAVEGGLRYDVPQVDLVILVVPKHQNQSL